VLAGRRSIFVDRDDGTCFERRRCGGDGIDEEADDSDARSSTHDGGVSANPFQWRHGFLICAIVARLVVMANDLSAGIEVTPMPRLCVCDVGFAPDDVSSAWVG
jgi:hypothetical protein